MNWIDTLSGEQIADSEIIDWTRAPLPCDNWYGPDDMSDAHPAWGCSPRSLFALHDDGAGPRWFPVERCDNKDPICQECSGRARFETIGRIIRADRSERIYEVYRCDRCDAQTDADGEPIDPR